MQKIIHKVTTKVPTFSSSHLTAQSTVEAVHEKKAHASEFARRFKNKHPKLIKKLSEI